MSASVGSLLARHPAHRPAPAVRFDDAGVRFPDIRWAAVCSKHRTLLHNCLAMMVAEGAADSDCKNAANRKGAQDDDAEGNRERSQTCTGAGSAAQSGMEGTVPTLFDHLVGATPYRSTIRG
jgi:hypothetical protein